MHYRTTNRISSFTVVILFFLLLLMSFEFHPVSAQTITRAPITGAVATAVTITGVAFLPNTLARVFYDGLQVGNATTSGTGGFKVIFAVPSSTAGVHNILATDGVNSIPTTFTVTSSLTRAPINGVVGTTITLTGYGYSASSLITVKWDGLTLATSPASVMTDSSGAFVATVLAPVGEPVSHDIIASDASNSVTVAFTLTRGIILSPTTGPVGSTVQVTGSGFLASNPITITFENVVVPTTPAVITSNAYGGFTASFNVIAVAPGARTVKALDNTGGSATATFTVTPSITLSVALGRGGTAVTVTGTGFVPTSTVLIKFNTTVLLNAPTDSTGGFVQAITIPYVPRGLYMVSANDTQGRTATATFTVTPLIAMSPGAGSAGTLVTVTGSGFTGNTVVSLFFGGSQMTTVPSTVFTDTFGAFTASFVVPLVTLGGWIVRAQDTSGYLSTATFTVGLNLVFSVARGTVGTVVTINGLGFAPISRITFTFDAIVLPTTPSTIITDILGIFQASFVIPESIGQNHLIVVNDSVGNRVSTAFTVDESISLNPISGDIGTTVVVTGTGFRQTNFVTITFDSNIVVTVPNPVETNSLGSFIASFIVPVVNPGARTVRATDNIGNLATATFTVTPSIALSVATGRGGTTTTITGTGFASLSTVTVKFDGNAILTAPTDSTGWFRQAITIPFVPTGSHIIQVVDAENRTATASFAVTPSITLSRANGIVGTIVSVTGVGFSANSNISLSFGGSPLNTVPSSVVTNSNGGFACSFYTPSFSAGVWSVRAIDSLGDKIDTTFTITRRLALSVTVGGVGRTVTAWGTGYEPNAQVIFTFDAFTLVTNPPFVTTNSSGMFNATFTIPEGIYGYHTITATDPTGGVASVTYTTSTSLTIYPSNGNAGTVVNVTGTGYGDTALVTIYLDNIPVTTNPVSVVTNAFGSFSATVTVDSGTPGAHTIKATDILSYSALATFTVTRQITLASRAGASLTAMTITGAGFNPLSSISLTWDGNPLSTVPSILTTDLSGGFIAFSTVPKDFAGRHYVNATDAGGHKASDTYTISPSITIAPDGLFKNDTTWITGRGFSRSSIITITWDGIKIITDPLVITTDFIGDFDASFKIPVNEFNSHRVVAVDQSGNIISTSYTISSSIIDVVLDVGSQYFRGEVAEFYALISQKGQPFNASTLTASLFRPIGTIQNLSADVVGVGIGTYRITYVVPGNATPGMYTLVLNVCRDFGGALCTGSALKAFQVSETFDQMNATLGAINGTVGSLSLDTGPILIKLDEIIASISLINSTSNGEILALISTTAGNITSKLDIINGTLSSINNQIATISTSFGPIHIDLDSIDAQIALIKGNMALVKSIVGSMNVSLTNLTPILTRIQGGNVTFQTDLGTIDVKLDDLQVRSIAVENKLVRIETDVGSIIAALENLTGVTIAVQTQYGPKPVTFFTDMDLSKVEYKVSEQSVLLSCNKGSESQGTLSLVMTKDTMNMLGTSPSEFRLFDGGQEIPFSVVELPNVYAFQITRGLGQHQLVFYMKGVSNMFSNPWLWLGGLGLLVALLGSYLLIRMRKGKVHVHEISSMSLGRIEKFIDETL